MLLDNFIAFCPEIHRDNLCKVYGMSADSFASIWLDSWVVVARWCGYDSHEPHMLENPGLLFARITYIHWFKTNSKRARTAHAASAMAVMALHSPRINYLRKPSTI